MLKLGLMNIFTHFAFDTAEAAPAIWPELEVQVVCSALRDLARRLSCLCRHGRLRLGCKPRIVTGIHRRDFAMDPIVVGGKRTTYLEFAAGGFRSASGEIAPPPHYQFIVAGRRGRKLRSMPELFMTAHFLRKVPVDVDEQPAKKHGPQHNVHTAFS